MRLVEDNAKKRFEVLWGYDPSPPKPKATKKKGQNQNQSKKAPVPKSAPSAEGSSSTTDAAGVDDLRKEMESALLDDKDKDKTSNPSRETVNDTEWKELPLVVVDREHPSDGEQGEWFIRASQGHSIKLEGTAHLTPVEDDSEGHERVGLMVHGTRDDLWNIIRTSTCHIPVQSPIKADTTRR